MCMLWGEINGVIWGVKGVKTPILGVIWSPESILPQHLNLPRPRDLERASSTCQFADSAILDAKVAVSVRLILIGWEFLAGQ